LHLLETVECYVLINADKNFKTSLQNTIHYEDLLADQSEYFEWPTLNENDACGMCYTSGTTGLPKGIIFSQVYVFACFHHYVTQCRKL
jgi:fatty-acyl-CoA synthase